MKKGDIVFSRVGSVDINALVTTLQDGWLFSGRVLRVRSQKQIDSDYLHYLLDTLPVKNDIVSRAVGQTMPSINTEILKSTKLVLSKNIEEQKLIAGTLRKLDDTLALHQRQLDNYKELKKAMLQKIFNQELRFKDQDGNDYPDWDEKKMGEIAKIRTGYTPPRKDKNNFGGDIIWISVADMKTKYIYDTKEYLSEKDVREAKWIEADTLIMSFKLSVGVLAITKIKCMSNEAIANFKWKNDITNNEYMYAYLSSQDISTYGNNASQGISLNNESLRKIRVPVPCKEEQQKIAEFFTLLDKKVESVKKGVELFKEQKKVFMQQMFL